MKQLDYFPFYYSYLERFSMLSDAELGRAVRGACSHGLGEEAPAARNRMVDVALKTIIFDLDRARDNYEAQLLRKQAGGKRGAAKRWSGTRSRSEQAPDQAPEQVPEAAPMTDSDLDPAHSIPMVSNGKPEKSDSDSESESKSDSKSKSKSKRESDPKSPLPGGVGGEGGDKSLFISLAGEDELLRQRMEAYLESLEQRKRRLTAEVLQALGRKLQTYPREQWIDIVDQSLRNGWSDLYDLPAPTRGGSRSGDYRTHGAPLSPYARQAVQEMLKNVKIERL